MIFPKWPTTVFTSVPSQTWKKRLILRKKSGRMIGGYSLSVKASLIFPPSWPWKPIPTPSTGKRQQTIWMWPPFGIIPSLAFWHGTRSRQIPFIFSGIKTRSRKTSWKWDLPPGISAVSAFITAQNSSVNTSIWHLSLFIRIFILYSWLFYKLCLE